MKQFINLIGVLIAGYAGYKLEPQLRPHLSSEPASRATPAQTTDSPAPAPEDFPPAPAAPEVSSTAQVAPPSPPPEETPTPAQAPSPLPEETTPAGDSLPVDAAPEPANQDPPPNPVTEVAADTPPAAVIETPSATPPNTPAVATDPVEAMKTSIRAGQIKEFTFDQVLSWEAAPDEQHEGESYTTGLASYKATTIFGEKTIQAKALIKNGTVQKWIWPKSGMEIK